MKIQKFSFFLLFILPLFGLAQPFTPFQRKTGGLERESIWRLDHTNDNQFLGIGTLGEGNDRDALIITYDLMGTILKAWTLGQSGRDVGRALKSLSDGSMVVLLDVRPYSNSIVDNLYIARITQNGTIIWARQLGDGNNDIYGSHILKTLDGNLLITGTMRPTDDGNDKGVLLKMNTNGSVLFRKQWNASSDYDSFTEAAEVDDGYIVTGYSDFINPDDSPVKAIVAKFDFNGNLIWSNAYDSGHQVIANNLHVLPNDDNTVIVAYGERGVNSTSFDELDIVVMKLNTDGSVIWANRYGNGAGVDIDALSFSLGGEDILINGDLEGVGAGGREGFVFRVGQDGTLKDVKLFGSTGDDFVNHLIPFKDENDNLGYMLAGSTSSFNIDGSQDIWLIKTDQYLSGFENCYTENVPFDTQPQSMQVSALGEVSNWDISSTPDLTLTPIDLTSINLPECEGVVDVQEEVPEQLELQLFPNPTTGRVNIRGDIKNIYAYQVVNLLGEVVAQGKLTANYIDLQQFKPGIYSVVFTDEQGRRLNAVKLCKQ